MVCRQIYEHRSVTQLFSPVIQLAFKRLALQVVSLPDGVIGVLNRQLGKRRRLAFAESFVKRSEFTHEDRRGPCVADDVMHRQQQDVILLGQSQQTRANQLIAREVEWATDLSLRAPLRFSFARFFGQVLETFRFDVEWTSR